MIGFYSCTQFARLIGVSPQTLRVWEREDKLKPSHKTLGGHRYYSQEQLNNYFNGSTVPPVIENEITT